MTAQIRLRPCVAILNSRVLDWELIDQGLSESEIGLMEGTTVSFCKSVSWQFAVGFGERVLNM
ncbi:hypothetical protein MUTS7_03760 (plasmid) [Escherichia coli]|nr:hypothetical protein MUTS7_03760 [Escherichia coli]